MKFLKRKILWFLAAAGARYLFRRGASNSISKQREELVQRLPKPLVEGVGRLPVDPLRALSSAVVVGKATRAAASTSTKAGRRATRRMQQARQLPQRLSNARNTARNEIQGEVDSSFRSLKSRYLALTEGPNAATEALLDIRERPDPLAGDLPTVPPASRQGRMRRLSRQPDTKVARVQRSYTPPIKPWDRPS